MVLRAQSYSMFCWVFAHTIAKNEVHELNADFNLERFHSGKIIDEKGVGPKPWIG